MAKQKRKKRQRSQADTDPGLRAEVERLEAAQDVEGLRRLADDRGSRDLARKALHRLREAGVEVPEARAAKPSVWKLPPEDTLPPSLMTAPDPFGHRVVWLLRDGRGGGLTVAQAALSEEDGVSELVVVEMGRARWRELRKDLYEDEGLWLADVPWETAAAVIRESLLVDPEDEEVRSRLSDLFPLLGEVEALSGPHPVHALLQDAPPVADGGEDLLDLAALDQWVPPSDVFRELLEAVTQARTGVLTVSDAQRAEQIETAIDRVTGRYFDADLRARYRRRLEDLAWVVAMRGARDAAARVVAGALALSTEADAATIPWCRRLFTRYLPEAPGPEPEPAGEARSEGGIILP